MALTEHMELAEPFERAGFTPPQAQALAGLIGVINRCFDGLETEMRTRFGAVDQRLGSLETEMRTHLSGVERELRNLPWKILAIMLTTAGLVVAALKWL